MFHSRVECLTLLSTFYKKDFLSCTSGFICGFVFILFETKFRNETRPRQGLLRTKEFLTKGNNTLKLVLEN